MKKIILIKLTFLLSLIYVAGQVQITIDPANEIKEISPYIYGRNNSLSDNPSQPTIIRAPTGVKSSTAKWGHCMTNRM